MRLYSDFQRYNMFRSPAWRTERVESMLANNQAGRATRRDDDFVRKWRIFTLRKRSGKHSDDELFVYDPGIYYAWQLIHSFADNPIPTLLVQARLLSRASFRTIAQKHNTTEDTIKWYEAMSFNVTDRLNSLDWIVGQVLTPAFGRHHGNLHSVYSYYDSTLKLLCYLGGPIVADSLITKLVPGQVVNSTDDVQTWLDEQWKAAARSASVHAILQQSMSSDAANEVLRLHARIIEIDNKADSTKSAMSSIERSILATVTQQPICHGVLGNEVYNDQPLGKYYNSEVEVSAMDAAQINRGELPEEREEVLAAKRDKILEDRKKWRKPPEGE